MRYMALRPVFTCQCYATCMVCVFPASPKGQNVLTLLSPKADMSMYTKENLIRRNRLKVTSLGLRPHRATVAMITMCHKLDDCVPDPTPNSRHRPLLARCDKHNLAVKCPWPFTLLCSQRHARIKESIKALPTPALPTSAHPAAPATTDIQPFRSILPHDCTVPACPLDTPAELSTSLHRSSAPATSILAFIHKGGCEGGL